MPATGSDQHNNDKLLPWMHLGVHQQQPQQLWPSELWQHTKCDVCTHDAYRQRLLDVGRAELQPRQLVEQLPQLPPQRGA